MKTLFSLCKIYVLRLINPQDPKLKKKLLAFVLLALLFGSYLVGYCYYAAKMLASVGMLDLLPPSIFTLASMFALMTSVYHVDGALINTHDDVILGALPITKKQLMLSRVIPIYIENLLLILAIFIPSMVMMNLFAPFSMAFMLRLLVLIPFAPMLPLALGLLLGLGIAYVSKRFKQSKLISILLTFIFIFVLYYYIFQMSNMSDATSLFGMISSLLTQIYPMASLFLNFLIDADIISLILYIAIQSLALIGFVMILSKYKDVTFKTKKANQPTQIKSKQTSALWALYRKELRRYFSSVTYVTNTAVTYVLLLGACVYLLFQDLDSLLAILDMVMLKETIVCTLPMIIGIVVGIGTTTSCSIALEGKNLWQLKTLPIKAQTIFLAKIMVNLTLAIPSIFIIGGILMYALKLDLSSMILIIGLPLLYATFFSQLGIIGNLFFPHLNWTSEVKAVKQGFATFFVIIGAMTLGMVPIFLLQTNIDQIMIMAILTIILVLGNIACYIYLNVIGPKQFYRL